jgi:hypothetical protein
MFYEKTATDYHRRSIALAKLNTIEFAQDDKGLCDQKADTDSFGPKTIAQVRSACRELPDLDLLVLLTKVDDFDPPAWVAPIAQYRPGPDHSEHSSNEYYFYDCRTLR